MSSQSLSFLSVFSLIERRVNVADDGSYDLPASDNALVRREAVRALRDDHAIHASLYTISDRCHKESEFGKRHGRRIARQNADGSLSEDEFNWYICPHSKVWRDHYVRSLVRTLQCGYRLESNAHVTPDSRWVIFQSSSQDDLFEVWAARIPESSG